MCLDLRRFLTSSAAISRQHSRRYESLCDDIENQPASFSHPIAQDIRRTFPDHEFFAGPTNGCASLEATLLDFKTPTLRLELFSEIKHRSEALRRVLSAFALHTDDTIYVQGMNFLAGFILLQSVGGQYDMGDKSAELSRCEESTFWLLASIFHRYELVGCFTAGLPTLQLCLAQWESLLQQYFPKLAAHMVRPFHVISFACIECSWFHAISILYHANSEGKRGPRDNVCHRMVPDTILLPSAALGRCADLGLVSRGRARQPASCRTRIDINL